jgi:hypothetical protein
VSGGSILKSCGSIAVLICLSLDLAFHASAATLDTTDGLQVTFSDATGGVSAVSADGVNVPLISGQWGGPAIKVGTRIPSSSLLQLSFNETTSSWTSALNADWNTGNYVAWQAAGGIDDSGHLLLGNGSTGGTGMALASPLPVTGGSRLKISWQARVANTATLQILCVRAYDAAGTDITASVSVPTGWMYSTTSLAHAIPGIQCSTADVWQSFTYGYMVPKQAAAVRVSLRYWNGGDGWVHIDDLDLAAAGIVWDEVLRPVSGPIQLTSTGFTQSVDVPDVSLHVDTTTVVSAGKIDVQIALQDTTSPLEDRPVLVYWILPVATMDWQWWDDLDTSRTISAGTAYSNTHAIANHAVGWYPYAAVNNTQSGVAMAVPMSEPLVQRFECDAGRGLYSLWEIGLSPVTTKIGAGRANFSCSLYGVDPAWGFRSATARYHAFYPEYFVKRTTAEGCWEWPVHPSQIPNPLDFGWVYHEAYPIDDPAERTLCKQLGIGIYHYVEPWLFWDSWGTVASKPTYDERVARITAWSTGVADLANWKPTGGIDDGGHLLLGDGTTAGAGMATPLLAVAGGSTVRISWQAQVANTATLQILGVRVYDASGADITATTPPPSGFGYSSTSQNHYRANIANSAAEVWETFSYDYTVASAATSIRVSVRHWNNGDHWVHIDNLKIRNVATGEAYVDWSFETATDGWVAALNADWENPANLWKREKRDIAAQVVLGSLPVDADGRYPIDLHSYICQMSDTNSYSQGWPVNSDPDLPLPSSYRLHLDRWVRYRLDEADGLYIDSVSTDSGLGNWENHRAEHLAVSDWPLTFSWADGSAAQLAPQAHEEFLQPVADELHAQGKLMMLNLFPNAVRYHAHQGDVQGSEVSELVESGAKSRVRRALAGTRVVTNLLQYHWDMKYGTSAEVEEYIRGQLFWGFFPGISSIGGPKTGGTPDRYFLHAELYERDRSLFQHYMPVIRLLGAAGWEPVPYATCTPAAETERFGAFDRGPVYLTLRGPDRAAYEGQVSFDLAGCGLLNAGMQVTVSDAFTGTQITATRDGLSLAVDVTVDAGDVRVLRLEAQPSLPDFDADSDVDMADFAHLQRCMSGAGVPQEDTSCRNARLDADSDVDSDDMTLFLQCAAGPAVAPDPQCVSH